MPFADDSSLGVAGLAVTVIGGGVLSLLGVWLKGKLDLDVNLLKRDAVEAGQRIAELEKREAECLRRTGVMEVEMIRLKASSAHSPTGFYLWAKLEDELILDASNGVQPLTGWRPAELVGKPLDVLLPPDVAARHHAGVKAALASGRVRSPDYAIRTRIRTRDGADVPVIVTLDPAPDHGPGVYRAEVTLSGAIIV